MKTKEKKPEEPKLPLTFEDLSNQINNLKFLIIVYFFVTMVTIICN